MTVIKEYRKRVLLVFLSLCILLMIFSIILVAPTFIDLYFQKSAAQFEKQQLESGEAAENVTAITQQIASIQSQIATINSSSGKSMISVLERFIAQPRSGIAISRIATSRATPMMLQIQGLAADRNSLVAFNESLKLEPSFSKVNLPVSSLAKNKDIVFDMSIEIKPQQ